MDSQCVVYYYEDGAPGHGLVSRLYPGPDLPRRVFTVEKGCHRILRTLSYAIRHVRNGARPWSPGSLDADFVPGGRFRGALFVARPSHEAHDDGGKKKLSKIMIPAETTST
jgi:hypothetical protein